jgi:hypothetical protein
VDERGDFINVYYHANGFSDTASAIDFLVFIKKVVAALGIYFTRTFFHPSASHSLDYFLVQRFQIKFLFLASLCLLISYSAHETQFSI